LVEIADRRAKGLCFKCDEKFVLGHKEECKRLFTIELFDEDFDESTPMISLHVLTGIQPRSGCTMQIVVTINDAQLSALLHSGSTHNFVDTAAAARARLQLSAQALRVVVANGDRISSPGCCQELQIKISNEHYSIDCYGLELGSFDMVLGVYPAWIRIRVSISDRYGYDDTTFYEKT
jgi:hypothetical protein